jgi:hypothetical protein
LVFRLSQQKIKKHIAPETCNPFYDWSEFDQGRSPPMFGQDKMNGQA